MLLTPTRNGKKLAKATLKEFEGDGWEWALPELPSGGLPVPLGL